VWRDAARVVVRLGGKRNEWERGMKRTLNVDGRRVEVNRGRGVFGGDQGRLSDRL
jgi:hypothetical protein